MPKFILDGQPVEFKAGESILFAGLRAGAFIPHYCAHEGLSTVATCRMCMVDIVNAGNGRPLPKLQTSCSTTAVEGMEIITKNKKVQLGREAIMEFLLVNHPLDCPICDQAGECTLQDFSFKYGTGKSIVNHHKRVYGWRDIGTFLQLERNRCIHCTRCVRFSQEVTGTHEMGTFGRAHQLTVDTFVDQPLTDHFQGNLADICPVGAITMKDFRFRKRVWHLENTNSVCAGCSTGCNISVQHHEGLVHRFVPRENQAVNRWWMCDLGRISFRNLINTETRQLEATADGQAQPIEAVIKKISAVWPKPSAASSLVMGSNQSTNEELHALQAFSKDFLVKPLLVGVLKPPTEPVQEKFIENLITQDKAPNTTGLKQLGFALQNSWESLQALDVSKLKLMIIVGNPTAEEWFLKLVKQVECSVHITHLKSVISQHAKFVLPSISHLEKTGTFINKQGRLQQNNKAVPAATGCLDECQIWAKLARAINPEYKALDQWQNNLDQLASENPAFAKVNPKNIPHTGVLLEK